MKAVVAGVVGLAAVLVAGSVAEAGYRDRDRGTRWNVSVAYSNHGGYGGGYGGGYSSYTRVSYGRGYGGGYHGGGAWGYRPAPVYYPRPVVVAPAPVYVPPPVVYVPPPVYCPPPVVYAPAPVYYPAPVVYQPPVYYAPAPVYYPSSSVSFGFSYRR